MQKNVSISDLAQALYTVNRHAKTALKPQHLYWIKKQTIHKLLEEKLATKIGLHFSDHPKFSNQHSTLLVQVGNYYFHIPPSKQDFQELEHLGKLNRNFRNPSSKMSLSQAKRIVYQYIDWHPDENEKPEFQKNLHTIHHHLLARWNGLQVEKKWGAENINKTIKIHHGNEFTSWT
ncbi:YkyB family protein [Virgibacillus sp. 179-BFC.A HS]|uniref:YkyB family protein n=1 Tax=Tigheibacillus jepli TaxID=3035914 RepID=A0ABU5CJK9_9BACI|nr:YkyB family protein [Virgibacillus sp. 179-BFC.A HS]MDY0406032.1 YkyB family protein [Virgibacillus sp. 179-BFC.A HS]